MLTIGKRLSATDAYEVLQSTTYAQWELLKAIDIGQVRAKNMPANRIGMTGDMSFVRLDRDIGRGGKLCTVLARNVVLAGLAELNPLSPGWLKLPSDVKKAMAKIERETTATPM